MLTSPFSNIKVVDLSSYIAGALCPGLLADFGASVIKVESLAGDPFRSLGPTFQDWNRGKRSICIDLKTEEGRRALYRLVEEADVVVENYRPGVARRLGADYRDTQQDKSPPRVLFGVGVRAGRAIQEQTGLRPPSPGSERGYGLPGRGI